jgi:hypothetical protein
VSNDENENIFDVALQGTGADPTAAEIHVTPASITFTNRNIASGPTITTTVRITNQALLASLLITNISLAGANADQFVLTGSTNASTLAPGANRTVSVAFDPSTAGPKTAVLRVISSDTDEAVTDVLLQGKGFDLNPCTAPNPTNTVEQNFGTNALIICPGLSFTGTTFSALADGASTCGPVGAPDVWYRYVPAANGHGHGERFRMSFTPTLSAHRALPGQRGQSTACAHGPSNQPPNVQISFAVTNGIPVFVRVAGNARAIGSFVLTMSGPDCFDFDRNRNGVTDTCEFDFGDAPAPYPTTLVTNGARHGAFTGVFLGKLADSNNDGLPTPLATGDNEDGPPGNDEDGVTFTSPLVIGQAATLLVEASTSGVLNAWIDFAANGNWSDAGDQVFTNKALLSGLNALSINVPNTAVATNLTFARFRFSTVSNLTFTGSATNGEVEDYALEILPVSQTPGGIAGAHQ